MHLNVWLGEQGLQKCHLLLIFDAVSTEARFVTCAVEIDTCCIVIFPARSRRAPIEHLKVVCALRQVTVCTPLTQRENAHTADVEVNGYDFKILICSGGKTSLFLLIVTQYYKSHFSTKRFRKIVWFYSVRNWRI